MVPILLAGLIKWICGVHTAKESHSRAAPKSRPLERTEVVPDPGEAACSNCKREKCVASILEPSQASMAKQAGGGGARESPVKPPEDQINS